MEKEIKLKEIESKVQIEKDKLEKQNSSNSSTQSGFDATKNIRLVPKFEENEVAKYFLHFKKIAENLNGLKNLGHCCSSQSSGEKSSPKHSQDSKHVLRDDSDVDPLSHNKFVIEQENDPELKDLGQRALTLQETEGVPVPVFKNRMVC